MSEDVAPVSGNTLNSARSAQDIKRSRQKKDRAPSRNIFTAIIHFIREIIDEMRKVVRPTRQELRTYTTVVIAFVALMMFIVFALDFGIARLVMWIFTGQWSK